MLHIYPINDLIEHNTESCECACNPTIDAENGLVIHDSLDRREVFENRTTKEMVMDFKEFPKMSRYSRDVIVTEKIDGTNASIYIGENGEFLTGSRTRWITPDNDNAGFSRWAHEHKEELLTLGVGHHFGEWWGSGIQRGYNLPKGEKRFSLFNVSRWGEEPILGKPVESRPKCCSSVPLIWVGKMDDLNVSTLMAHLKAGGSFASKGFMNPEGIVIFHTGGNFGLKKTFEKDEQGKWAA